MAQLILSDAEKAAQLWTDLDDASLGAMLRKKLAVLDEAAMQMNMTFTVAAAMMVCCHAAETQSNELRIEVDGITQDGRAFGDWSVVATRKAPNA